MCVASGYNKIIIKALLIHHRSISREGQRNQVFYNDYFLMMSRRKLFKRTIKQQTIKMPGATPTNF